MADERSYSKEWEKVTAGTYRMMVPCGWLVKQYASPYRGDGKAYKADESIAVSLCFVADPERAWLL